MWRQTMRLVIGLVVATGTARGREWTDTTGQYHTEARLLQCCRGTAWLEQPNGRLILVPVARLSERDRAYVEREFPNQGGAAVCSVATPTETAPAKKFVLPTKPPAELELGRQKATFQFASHARQPEQLPDGMPAEGSAAEEVPQPPRESATDKYIYSGCCGTFHLIDEIGTGAYWYQGKLYLAMLTKAGEDENYLYYDSNHPDGQIIQWYFSKTQRCCKYWVWKRTGITTHGHYERQYRASPN